MGTVLLKGSSPQDINFLDIKMNVNMFFALIFEFFYLAFGQGC